MYEITITKTGSVTEDAGGDWTVIEEYIEDGLVLKKRGYTPSTKVSRTKQFEIYRQQVEDDDFDLVNAIAALNGLQLPPKVAGK